MALALELGEVDAIVFESEGQGLITRRRERGFI